MNNRNKNLFFVILILVIIVGIFLYVKSEEKRSNGVNTQEKVQQIISKDTNVLLPNSLKVRESKQFMEQMPQWAKQMIEIDESSLYDRKAKIEKLVELLKQNKADAQAVEGILTCLMKYNPIEATDEIIPYLAYNNPHVQSAAVGTLGNAAIPSEAELKHRIPENEEKRQRIAQAINELKNTPNTSDAVRLAIVSSYGATNPSIQDSKQMTKEIMSQSTIADNEAAYLASTLLNGQEVNSILTALKNKDVGFREQVVSYIGNNIAENPATASVPSQQQKNELADFIRNNPPSSQGENFGANNDVWKNTLNVLNNQN